MPLNEDLVSCIIVPYGTYDFLLQWASIYWYCSLTHCSWSSIDSVVPLLVYPSLITPNVCLLCCSFKASCYLRTLVTAFFGPIFIFHLLSTLKHLPTPCICVWLPLLVCGVRPKSTSLAVSHHSVSCSTVVCGLSVHLRSAQVLDPNLRTTGQNIGSFQHDVCLGTSSEDCYRHSRLPELWSDWSLILPFSSWLEVWSQAFSKCSFHGK